MHGWLCNLLPFATDREVGRWRYGGAAFPASTTSFTTGAEPFVGGGMDDV